MKKKVILMLSMVAFVVCLFAISASALVVDGIDYSFKNGEATVTAENKNCLLTVVNIPQTVTVTEEHTDTASLHGTYTVAYIADSAFRDNKVVTEITTPSTIKSIGEHAFRSMTALKRATINATENFKYFNNAEFWGDGELEYVDLSGCKGLMGIGNGSGYDDTFVDCRKLHTVILPKGVTIIGNSAFFNCYSLTSIENLEVENITYFGNKAFWGTKPEQLKGAFVLNENTTQVGDHAFRGTGITGLVLRMSKDATQTAFNDATFYGCSNLKYIVLPDNIQTIGQYTFSGCSSLEYVVLGSGIKTFSTTSTFGSCGALKAIIYQGSEEEFKALTGVSCLGTVEMASFADYTFGVLPSKRTVYYGAKVCTGCNGILGEEGFIFEDLLSEMKIGQKCYHCAAEVVTATYAPVFVDLGYSVFELNGSGSIMQGFKIDYDSLNEYNKHFESAKIGDFGVLAAVETGVGNSAFDENKEALSGVLAYEVISGHNYFEIKVTNIPINEAFNEATFGDVKFHLCAYVFVGDEIYYVTENYAGTDLGPAVSFNDKK
ncbi:MAG: leucine-rich repeat domain-containing protein [Clostridia bacterium]|nr:leucine-rich repeat domain-containing protein [Clostridia bacterium]